MTGAFNTKLIDRPGSAGHHGPLQRKRSDSTVRVAQDRRIRIYGQVIDAGGIRFFRNSAFQVKLRAGRNPKDLDRYSIVRPASSPHMHKFWPSPPAHGICRVPVIPAGPSDPGPATRIIAAQQGSLHKWLFSQWCILARALLGAGVLRRSGFELAVRLRIGDSAAHEACSLGQALVSFSATSPSSPAWCCHVARLEKPLMLAGKTGLARWRRRRADTVKKSRGPRRRERLCWHDSGPRQTVKKKTCHWQKNIQDACQFS